MDNTKTEYCKICILFQDGHCLCDEWNEEPQCKDVAEDEPSVLFGETYEEYYG